MQRTRLFVYYEPKGLKTRSVHVYSTIANQWVERRYADSSVWPLLFSFGLWSTLIHLVDSRFTLGDIGEPWRPWTYLTSLVLFWSLKYFDSFGWLKIHSRGYRRTLTPLDVFDIFGSLLVFEVLWFKWWPQDSLSGTSEDSDTLGRLWHLWTSLTSLILFWSLKYFDSFGWLKIHSRGHRRTLTPLDVFDLYGVLTNQYYGAFVYFSTTNQGAWRNDMHSCYFHLWIKELKGAYRTRVYLYNESWGLKACNAIVYSSIHESRGLKARNTLAYSSITNQGA